MESSGVNITCPNCGAEININEILYHQLAEDIKKQFANQQAEEKKRIEQEISNLAAQKDEFEKRKQRENELFQERLTAKLAEEKNVLEQQLKQKITSEQSEQFAVMQKELQEQSEKLKELNQRMAILLVSHDTDMVLEYAKSVVHLHRRLSPFPLTQT